MKNYAKENVNTKLSKKFVNFSLSYSIPTQVMFLSSYSDKKFLLSIRINLPIDKKYTEKN